MPDFSEIKRILVKPFGSENDKTTQVVLHGEGGSEVLGKGNTITNLTDADQARAFVAGLLLAAGGTWIVETVSRMNTRCLVVRRFSEPESHDLGLITMRVLNVRGDTSSFCLELNLYSLLEGIFNEVFAPPSGQQK